MLHSLRLVDNTALLACTGPVYVCYSKTDASVVSQCCIYECVRLSYGENTTTHSIKKPSDVYFVLWPLKSGAGPPGDASSPPQKESELTLVMQEFHFLPLSQRWHCYLQVWSVMSWMWLILWTVFECVQLLLQSSYMWLNNPPVSFSFYNHSLLQWIIRAEDLWAQIIVYFKSKTCAFVTSAQKVKWSQTVQSWTPTLRHFQWTWLQVNWCHVEQICCCLNTFSKLMVFTSFRPPCGLSLLKLWFPFMKLF